VSSVRRGADRSRSRPVVKWLAMALAAAVLLGGCGLFGKPAPLSADAPITMQVTSPQFVGGVIPAMYTCHGKGESPPIFWSAPPPGTKSLAVVIDDSDAPISPRVYWIVYDISPATTDLQAGTTPPHSRIAYNSSGRPDYDPPCPGTSLHRYRFTVYALNTYFGNSLPNRARLAQALPAIAAHVTARGTQTFRALP
jgi:hypothetical protein